MLRLAQIAYSYFKVGPMLEARVQPCQMVLVDIGSDITLAPGDDLPREVSNAGADLQHRRADIRPDGIGHPLIEADGTPERLQNFSTGFFVNVAAEPVAQNNRQRRERIFQPDLLSFGIRAAVVADRHFV